MSIILLFLTLLSGASFAGEPPKLADDEQKLGYSIGYRVGADFSRQGLPIEARLLVKGALDALADAEPAMSRDEMRRTLTELKRQAAENDKR